MPHSLICGMTTSGKSALAHLLAARWKAAGVRPVALDPSISRDWPADTLVFTDPEQFIRFAKANANLALFVDEGAAALERAADYNWLTTRARHWGHESHIISQRPQDITPAIRGNCETLWLFHIDIGAAELLAREWNESRLREAAKNPRLSFHLARRLSDDGCQTGRIDFARRGIVFLRSNENANPRQRAGPDPADPPPDVRSLPGPGNRRMQRKRKGAGK